MKRLLTILALLCLPSAAAAQTATVANILSPTRSTVWSGAGVVGGIPSASWTKCGSTMASTSTAAQIITQLGSCSANQYVLLGPGTFNLTAGISIVTATGKVVLRGSGANQTTLAFGAGAAVGCGGSITGVICAAPPSPVFPPPSTTFSVTAGLSQGSTSLTLSSTTGIVANQTVVILTQCSDGLSGNPCTGTSTDNGNFFNCDQVWSSPNGCSFNGADTGDGWADHFQQEMFTVTNVNAGTGVITLSRPLRNPNWNSARTPVVWFYQPIPQIGIENLSIDTTADTTPSAAIKFSNTINSWVTGVRIVNSPILGIWNILGLHDQFEQNYLSGSNTTPSSFSTVGHGIDLTMTSDTLFQNNILQGLSIPIHFEGPSDGAVIGYNFCVNDFYPSDNETEAIRTHSNGNNYNLFEGNVCPVLYLDDTHGPTLMSTAYRNFFSGWESCANGQCGVMTAKGYHANPVIMSAFSREHNFVGNVLGTPVFHSAYQSVAPTNGGANNTVYVIGEGGGAQPVPGDSIVSTTSMRWANYDVKRAAVSFCGGPLDTGWSATCGSVSEIPGGISPYPNQIPTCGDTALNNQCVMPPSLYLAATPKPAWFQSITWPPIGPDVTSGNIGQCSGALNVLGQFNGVPALTNLQCGSHGITASAWGGHVNAIPAMSCYLLVMGGVPDGTGSALTFNPNACYSTVSAPIATFTPSSVNFGQVPAGLTSNPIPVTLQNTGSANLPVSTVSLGSAVFSLINNTCGSPATITNTIPGTGFTLTPGASCTFQAIYQPVVPNFTNTASVFFSPGASNPDALSLTGNSTGPSAPSIINFAGKVTTHGLCKQVPETTQLCFAVDCGCWWMSMNGAAYTPFGVSSVNGKTGAVILGIQ